MWQLKIKVKEKWNIYNSRTIKFNINILLYSHNFYEEKGKLFFIASGIVEGSQKDKKRFFIDLKKDKKVTHLEKSGDFFICIYSEMKKSKRAEAAKTVYNPKIIFVNPVIIDSEGWEEWWIASKDRKDLEKIIKFTENLELEYKIEYFNEKKIKNIMVYSAFPELTEKQKEVFLLAIKHGYYGYPRKITLKKLSKMTKISLSTFQFHLAKAEAKLMPFIFKKIAS